MDDWVSVAARERPEHMAVEAPDGALTYAELHVRADGLARRLVALGVGEGGRVATTLAPSAELCALMHAAPRVGAALVPLNTRLPSDAQRRQAGRVGADVVVDGPLDGMEASIEPRHDLDAEAVHTVLFTSGTEGEPKAVELTVGNHDASAAGSTAMLGVAPADRWLCAVPLFHVAGLGILVRCARNATTAVVHDGFDAAAVTAALADDGVTLVSLVPTQLRRLRATGLLQAPALRALLLGGGPIPPDLVDWARDVGLPVRCTYGMTETASQVAVSGEWESAAEPLPNAEIEICEDGEILVRGPMVAPGAIGEDGRLHTGDRGRLDRHGRLHVEGRIKELIVTGGEKVAPAAVEAVLLSHPAVADAGVTGTADPEWGEAVTAFIVERQAVSDYDVAAFCRERLAGYQVPKRVVRVDSIPRNAGGKILRDQLKSRAA
jgi:o-succinylbenzoate---CoA ligase